jgi:SAM-dependent methyltransferase
MDQNGANDGGRLPFRDGSLDLICNRHESFLALEVSRVLAPGGTFVTQQVDYHDNDDLARILGMETPEEPDSWIGRPSTSTVRSASGDYREGKSQDGGLFARQRGRRAGAAVVR